MTKKRSDALQALIAEVADLDVDITLARTAEEAARVESTAARQALDHEIGNRTTLEARRAATQKALDIIQTRDAISDDVVEALATRAAARNGR
jgi:uncharacterized protein YPO0396